MTTDHWLQDETLRSYFREDAVGNVLLGSPDIRWPPDTGQQAGRSAHWVVARTGHLLVPCLRGTASDQHGYHHDEEHEFSRHLHVEHWCFGPAQLYLKRLVLLVVTAPLLVSSFPESILIGTPSSSSPISSTQTALECVIHTHLREIMCSRFVLLVNFVWNMCLLFFFSVWDKMFNILASNYVIKSYFSKKTVVINTSEASISLHALSWTSLGQNKAVTSINKIKYILSHF